LENDRLHGWKVRKRYVGGRWTAEQYEF
jgi:hypothetical protein